MEQQVDQTAVDSDALVAQIQSRVGQVSRAEYAPQLIQAAWEETLARERSARGSQMRKYLGDGLLYGSIGVAIGFGLVVISRRVA